MKPLVFLLSLAAATLAAEPPAVVTTRQAHVNLALGAQATASTEEKQNPASHAIDGEEETRWCASGGRPNEWLQVDLGRPQALTGFRVSWESPTNIYLHKIEVSRDGQAWQLAADRSNLDTAGPCSSEFKGAARYVRVTFLNQRGRSGGFGSIRELQIFGEALAAPNDATAKTLAPLEIPPGHPDARWLSDLKVAPGFDVSIFAHPPMVSYPIFLSAAVDGTLFVGTDLNGSIGRDLHHGKILRLRDTDGDGRADEVKEFVADIDTPRGVVWDHDRLYVLHPPDLSVFIDHRGAGVADEKRDLVRGLGWTFKDRPGDHASNGVELGIDGWLYCSIGDFGFLHAEGTDGRSAQLRGGGVVRVRPDGTGFEIYARGTRNILEAAVSPLLDLFARDNTNDGDGWDTRFHHFTGLENHGYPRLFKNFPSEIVKRLADYGGGSATGSCWVDEPGIPALWNHSLLTCDWGRNFIYQHNLVPNGATFTTDQNEFFGATRVTDVDIDAQSRLYIASWKGATFNYNGPDVGYLVRLVPHGYTPPPLPDFDHASVPELVKLLENPSHRLRLEAQRTLLRRDDRAAGAPLLQALAGDRGKPLASRIAALFGLKQLQGAGSHEFIAKLASDETIAAWAIRALTDREDQLAGVPLAPILAGLRSPDARTRREAAVSIARLDKPENAAALQPLLDDPDPIVSHTAVAALERLHAVDLCLAVVDAPASSTVARTRALQVLAEEHQPAVVDALLARLPKTPAHRELLTALCRLYFVEGPWEGGSWGTRPDTRGPYYQPEEWSETKRIGAALLAELNHADADEAKFLSAEFARHRIKPGDATGKLIALAQKDSSITPTLARQFAQQDESAPGAAVPLLAALAVDANAPIYDRGQAVQALVKVDDPAAIRAAILALGAMGGDASHRSDQERTEIDKARKAFFATPKLENEPPLLIELAASPDRTVALLADGGLLKLAGKKFGAPEPRDVAQHALQQALAVPAQARTVAEAMRSIEDSSQLRLLLPLLDSGDAASVRAAEETFKRYKVEPASLRAGAQGNAPLLATMKTEAILDAIVNTHGEVQRGEQLFTQQGCVACHTTKAEEPLKGPFLGVVAGIYQRRDLAENILLPNKSIAQGFATNHFVLQNGTEVDGFVTTEAADKVSIRTITSQELTFPKKEIKARSVLEKSLMPEGLVANLTVKDFASLVDFLESLVKK